MNFTSASFASLLPLAMGGVFSYFKPFMEDQKEFRNRCFRMMTKSSEEVAVGLQRLLEAAFRSKETDEMARGDGYKSRDLYDEVATAIAKQLKVSFRSELRLRIFRLSYLVLLAGFVIGFLSLAVSVVSSGHESLVTVVALSTTAIEIVAVIIIYFLTRRCEDDEEIV